MAFVELYRVLLDVIGFYSVVLAFVQLSQALLGFTGFYWVLLGFTGIYWVLLGFTGLYWALLGLTGFYWVAGGCLMTGNIRKHPIDVTVAEVDEVRRPVDGRPSATATHATTYRNRSVVPSPNSPPPRLTMSLDQVYHAFTFYWVLLGFTWFY